jgi:general secretion pathway protein E
VFLERIPHEFAREHLLLSQGSDEEGELLAIGRSTRSDVIFNVGVSLGCKVRTVVADEEQIARTLDQVYGQRRGPAVLENVAAPSEQDLEELLREVDRDLLSTQGKGPVVQFVDAVLLDALGRKASDVHVQPVLDRVLIRLRVDGALHTVREVQSSVATALISRIKVMGRMDIAERREAQDGRASVTLGDRSVDLRISTFPTSYGERAVVRLLDNSEHLCDLESIGMPADLKQQFVACARRTSGIVLVTGPTGSGKTTTLYSTLRRVATDHLNIMTIEDPIEYELSTVGLAVSQSQVNSRKGVSFATGLRHILRQDPDIILVGEIRDAETARMAIQSSLTGHLVFSTLHTNDAPSAVTRLLDLGVEPYLVAASITAVLAQRLVRLSHAACAGQGCESCFGTGLQGRRGIFELMVVDDAARQLLHREASVDELRRLARQSGMTSLREEGEQLVGRGETTSVEVDRVVQGSL